MILPGIDQGAALGQITIAAVTSVEAEDAGEASGLFYVANQLGCSPGLACLSSFLPRQRQFEVLRCDPPAWSPAPGADPTEVLQQHAN